MIALLLSLFLFADPFWTTKPAREWTDIELQSMFAESPWAQSVEGPGQGAPAVQVYLATAGPMRAAEAERDRRIAARRRPGAPAPENSEYQAWMKDNGAGQIVLAVRMQTNKGMQDGVEVKRMEDETTLRAGKKKIKLTGSFPPSAGDPYLRLAFPRQVELSDKNALFELYIPGLPSPFRSAEFKLKDLAVNGKLEM